MGGDALARGAKSATFAMGGDKKGSPIELKNVAPESELPSLVDNSALFVRKRPSVVYRGIPMNGTILIKRVERQTDSMIIIPHAAQAKSDTGIVVSMSKTSQLPLQPGSMVLFDKFAAVGQEVELMDENGEKQELLLVHECDILLELNACQVIDNNEVQ